MKNLKKFIAIILAATMSFSNIQFLTASEINYSEEISHETESEETENIEIENEESEQNFTNNPQSIAYSGLSSITSFSLDPMSGSGTEDDPYLISNVEQLKSINSNLDAHYKLISDIDLNNEEWEPLGNWTPFKGTFDGMGHTVKNLYISTYPSISAYGFFGFTQNATIKNLKLENVNIDSSIKTIGAITGTSSDTSIINCAVTGTGQLESTSASTNAKVGGLVGYGTRLTIQKSYSTIDLKGEREIGGIIGSALDNSLIENCYSLSHITPGTSYYAGLLGHTTSSNVIIKNSYFGGIIEGVQRLTVGQSQIINSYYDYSKDMSGSYHNNSQAKTTTELMQKETFVDWDFDEIWDIKEGESYPYLRNNNQDNDSGVEEPTDFEIIIESPKMDVYFEGGNYYLLETEANQIEGKIIGASEISSIKYELKCGKMVLSSGELGSNKNFIINNVSLMVGSNLLEITVVDKSNEHHVKEFYIININESNESGLNLDRNDSDNDGLLNYEEDILGTEKNNPDTDGDGLTDYQEVSKVGTSPFLMDTDNNGISDGDEDLDNDNLTNIQEINLNGNPKNTDTDFDDLDDYEEFILGTKLDTEDTDEDGLSDGDEIELGLNPLIQKTDSVTLDSLRIFEQSLKEVNIANSLLSDENEIIPSLYFIGQGNLNGNTFISEGLAYELEDNDSIKGQPIEISTGSDFTNGAELSFKISETLTDAMSKGITLAICQFTDDGEIIPLETNYNVDTATVNTTIYEMGIYFILDVNNFLLGLGIDPMSYFEDEQKENERLFRTQSYGIEESSTNLDFSASEDIENQIQSMSENSGKEQVDIVFIIDTTESMSSRRQHVINRIHELADKLWENYDARFAIMEYKDLVYDNTIGTGFKVVFKTHFYDLSTKHWFRGQLNDLSRSSGGGSDKEETTIDALEHARRTVLSIDTLGAGVVYPPIISDKQTFFVLITDAGYKVDNRFGVKSMDDMIERLKNSNINVSVVTTPSVGSDYEALYTKTCGLYVDIDSNFNTQLESIPSLVGPGPWSGSGTENAGDYWILLKGIMTPVKLDSKPKIGSYVDTDSDGIKDIDELSSITGEVYSLQSFIELILKTNEKTWQQYIVAGGQASIDVWGYYSNPVVADTDFDGYPDATDPNPKKWDISDRDLAMASAISYYSLDYFDKGEYLGNIRQFSKDVLNNKHLGNLAYVEELKGWKVIDTWDMPIGFQAIVFEKDDNIIVAYRGTEPKTSSDIEELIKDWLNNYSTFFYDISFQAPIAKQFIEKTIKNNKFKDVYIAGHSLGGHLAYSAGAKGLDDIYSPFIKRIVTFNGLGFGILNKYNLPDEYILAKNASIIRNYSVEKDPVAKGIVGTLTRKYGIIYTYEKSEKAPDSHSLFTFLDKLEPLDRSNP